MPKQAGVVFDETLVLYLVLFCIDSVIRKTGRTILLSIPLVIASVLSAKHPR